MTEELKKSILQLWSKNIQLVWCPNESLGSSGPFVQLDSFEEIEEMLEYEKVFRDMKKDIEEEIMITGS